MRWGDSLNNQANNDNSPCVYVIDAVGTGYYKIGYSENIQNRIGGLQSGIPFDLDIVALYFTDQYKYLEKILHERFEEKRRKGSEWFRLSKADIDFFCNKTTEEMLNQFPPMQRLPVEQDIVKALKTKPCDIKIEIYEKEIIEAKEEPKEFHEFYDGLVPEVLGLFDELGTWQAVADHYKISKKLAWNIGVHKLEPILDGEARSRLGLSGICEAFMEMPEDVE